MDYEVDDSRLEEYVSVTESASDDGGSSTTSTGTWEMVGGEEGSSDVTVLLKAELEDCKREQKRLHRLWSEQLEVNAELKSIKQALSDEIVELSNSLFTEANEMVASEARARNRVELSLEAVRRELQLTKEHLAVERQQLMELRSRLGNMQDLRKEAVAIASLTDDTVEKELDIGRMSLRDQCAGSLNLEYFADLLPGYQFHSRSSSAPTAAAPGAGSSISGVSVNVWDGICAGIDVEDFASFVKFVQDVVTSRQRSETLVVMDKHHTSSGRLLVANRGDSAGAAAGARTGNGGSSLDCKKILEHEFVKEIEAVDVYSILRLFVSLSKTIRSRLPMAMLRNTLTIELHPHCRSLHSPTPSNINRDPEDTKCNDVLLEEVPKREDGLLDKKREGNAEGEEEEALQSGSESDGAVSMIESASSAEDQSSRAVLTDDAPANSSLRIGEFFKKTFAAMSSTPSLLDLQTTVASKDFDRLSLCSKCAFCGRNLRWPSRSMHAPSLNSIQKTSNHPVNAESRTASPTAADAVVEEGSKETGKNDGKSPVVSNLSSTSLMLSSTATDTFEYLHASMQSSSSLLSSAGAAQLKQTLPSTIYRLRLTDDSPWMVIDGSCRDRLVALAHYYTFLRHLSRGLFTHRPLIDLYFDLLHLRRNLCYVRLGGAGATSFFIQSDFEHFADRIESLLRLGS